MYRLHYLVTLNIRWIKQKADIFLSWIIILFYSFGNLLFFLPMHYKKNYITLLSNCDWKTLTAHAQRTRDTSSRNKRLRRENICFVQNWPGAVPQVEKFTRNFLLIDDTIKVMSHLRRSMTFHCSAVSDSIYLFLVNWDQ